MLPEDLDAYLRSEATHLVVHRDYVAERRHMHGVGPKAGPPTARRSGPSTEHLAHRARLRWGAPLYEDSLLSVWDLDDVRRRAARQVVSSAARGSSRESE